MPANLTEEEAEEWHAPSLLFTLLRTFRARILLGSFLRLISDGCSLGSPFVLREYIRWLTDPRAKDGEGWQWLGIIVGLQVVMSITLNAAAHHIAIGFEQMRGTCILEVFEAALKFPADHQSTGRLLSAHASDTNVFGEMAIFVHGLYVSPLLVIGAVVGMCIFVGWAGLACFGLMLIISPTQGRIMKYVFSNRAIMLKETDKRVAAVNECLRGIRICKFMGWEENFAERIAGVRSCELESFGRILRSRAALQWWPSSASPFRMPSTRRR
jgi:ABC-type multidrug transport system fused ATPase/permease subunit